jgi:hypothetical protein
MFTLFSETPKAEVKATPAPAPEKKPEAPKADASKKAPQSKLQQLANDLMVGGALGGFAKVCACSRFRSTLQSLSSLFNHTLFAFLFLRSFIICASHLLSHHASVSTAVFSVFLRRSVVFDDLFLFFPFFSFFCSLLFPSLPLIFFNSFSPPDCHGPC